MAQPRRRRHGGAVGSHDLPAEGLLLIADLDHEDLAVQIKVGAGHAQGRAPLAGAGLGGDALKALLLGVVCLRDGGIELMGTAGVVALEFVVDLRRSLELLLQAVGPDQRGRTIHLVEILDLLGDGNVGVFVIQLLLHQLVTEHAAKLLRGHGLVGAGIEQRGRLVLHVRPDIVPCLRHLRLFEVDLVGDFLVCHGKGSFLIRAVARLVVGTKKRSCPRESAGTGSEHPAVPPGLTHELRPLCAY